MARKKKTSHVHEASPGTHTFFPSYTCHIYCKRFRAVIGLRLVWQSHPRLQPLYGFCPSGQRFAAGFLQIPRHQGHPCLWLYPSHCRVDSGLSPVRTCARRAHKKIGRGQNWPRPLCFYISYVTFRQRSVFRRQQIAPGRSPVTRRCPLPGKNGSGGPRAGQTPAA